MTQPTLMQVVENVERVIRGKRKAVETVVAGLLAGGHVLIEDVPGVGKTMLARALARSLDLEFRRVQCTPDLLPSDITGVNVFRPDDRTFQFRPGPVFTHVLLVDEVNRATPRTQSALLEAMEERQVSVDGVTYQLGEPFFLIATQNPIELAGTFPLPEAQLDRFLVRVHLGHPTDDTEVAILTAHQERHPIETLEPVADRDTVLAARAAVRRVFVHPSVIRYVQSVTAETRRHEQVAHGASTRGALSLMRAAQALAALRGEDHVSPDHVKRLATDVLAHRIVLQPRARVRGASGAQVVEDVLAKVSVPVDVARGA